NQVHVADATFKPELDLSSHAESYPRAIRLVKAQRRALPPIPAACGLWFLTFARSLKDGRGMVAKGGSGCQTGARPGLVHSVSHLPEIRGPILHRRTSKDLVEPTRDLVPESFALPVPFELRTIRLDERVQLVSQAREICLGKRVEHVAAA